ncbi:MAG: hypothetical protein JXX28_17355, partial [Deltaproteobacteria bacterium]|nr:hypothetical protein [Deltaproteobacteria bacterium]
PAREPQAKTAQPHSTAPADLPANADLPRREQHPQRPAPAEEAPALAERTPQPAGPADLHPAQQERPKTPALDTPAHLNPTKALAQQRGLERKVKVEAAQGGVDLFELAAPTVEQLRANFERALAAHPQLDVTWDRLHEVIRTFLNATMAGSTDEGRSKAGAVLANFLGTIQTKPDVEGASPATSGLSTRRDRGTLWTGRDPVLAQAKQLGDSLEGSTFAGMLFDGVDLQLAGGIKTNSFAMWEEISRVLAKGMSGKITVATLFGYRPGSVFDRIETEELKKLPDGLITGLEVHRYFRDNDGGKDSGGARTTARSGVTEGEVVRSDLDSVARIGGYGWNNGDLANPYFAVMGGHMNGAPPAYAKREGLGEDWGKAPKPQVKV